ATRNYGADIRLVGETVEACLQAANEFAEETGALLVPPFDDDAVIAGQGTVALEMLESAPEIENLIIPIGGGGLIAGTAAAAKQWAKERGQRMKVIGVQAENAAPYPPSLAAGHPIQIETKPTIADGIAVAKPGL